MYAAAIAIDRVVEPNVGTVVVRDDVARLRLFKHFEPCFRRLANPLN
jgi:hypothetical protein